LGEASYTLIDDNGIEFFLSPMDKRRRRLEGKEEGGSTGRMVPPAPPSQEIPQEPQRVRLFLQNIVMETDYQVKL
jgi:hypothetical protein